MAIGPTQKLTHDSKILIVGGAGTIGCSTALHLSRRGYTSLSLIDAYPFPLNGFGNSQSAGGSDINKIVGFSNSGVRGELAEKTMEAWRQDEVFRDYYKEVGEFTAGSTPEDIAALHASFIAHDPSSSDHLEWLSTPSEITSKVAYLKGNPNINGWQGIWRRGAGYAKAMDAVDSVGRELARRGVGMTFGPSGTFKKPIIGETGRCIGVECKDGTMHYADRVIMATGAWTPSLVDLEGQCISKCWIVAHLELSEEEASRYRNIPVVYNSSLGFLFEPRFIPNPDSDPSKPTSRWIIKLCDEFPGYTRYMNVRPFGAQKEEKVSVPRSHSDHPSDTVPDEGMERLRRVVEVLLPEFKERAFVKSYCCWCTDTADADWLFCQHPKYPGLFLATGDSGHSFTTLPTAGAEVADLLEGKMSAERMRKVRWRPGRGDPDHTGRDGPPPKDLNDLPGWAHGDDPHEI